MDRRQTASPPRPPGESWRESLPETLPGTLRSPDRRQQPPDAGDEFLTPFDDEAWDVFLPDGDLEPLPDFRDLWWDTDND